MEWVISIIPRDKMFAACFNNIFTIFLQYFYNMFTRRVFTKVFTTFLAERFYNVFTNTVSPFSFILFTM